MNPGYHVAITGATGGIGRSLALRFAAEGYRVSAFGRDPAALAALSDAGEVHPFGADVSDAQSCATAMVEAAGRLGPIDVLIANAAIHPKAFFLDQSADQFAEVLAINVGGVANSIRPVLPGMLDRNFGRIVVMGSLADVGVVPGSVAYSVSKGALHALVRGIAAEIDRPRYPNVLINEFSPGATRSGMSDYGNSPEDIFDMLIPLVRCEGDGPQGQFFQEGRHVRIGESWKGALKRILLRR